MLLYICTTLLRFLSIRRDCVIYVTTGLSDSGENRNLKEASLCTRGCSESDVNLAVKIKIKSINMNMQLSWNNMAAKVEQYLFCLMTVFFCRYSFFLILSIFIISFFCLCLLQPFFFMSFKFSYLVRIVAEDLAVIVEF